VIGRASLSRTERPDRNDRRLRSASHHPLAEQFAGDDVLLDIGSPLVDLGELRVAVEPLDVEVVGVVDAPSGLVGELAGGTRRLDVHRPCYVAVAWRPAQISVVRTTTNRSTIRRVKCISADDGLSQSAGIYPVPIKNDLLRTEDISRGGDVLLVFQHINYITAFDTTKQRRRSNRKISSPLRRRFLP